MQDVFFLDKSQYNTPIAPLKSYVEQLTLFIQKSKGWSFEQAKEAAYRIVKKHFSDKPLKCFERLENGDKALKDTTLFSYIKDNLAEGNFIAPTFTTYVSRKKKVSIIADFLVETTKRRSIVKKAAQAAKAKGDLILADNKNNEQNNLKTYSNSASGAFAQEACILHNPANHSTLTSITRTMTSLSNANNERIIAGNRYYPRGIDVLNNLIYIVTYADTAKIHKAIEEYRLHIPSVADTISVLKRSSDLYFTDNRYYEKHIIPFLNKLTPYELAAVCYCGDFYHLRVFNPSFVKKLLEDMCQRVTTDIRDPDVVSKIHTVDENIINLAHHVFFKELKGKGKVYSEINEKYPGVVDDLYATCMSSMKALEVYKNFFSTFFMNNILPNNAFRLANMRRRTVVLSDTDSTCFTLDEWIKWYNGTYEVNDQTIAIGGTIAYIVTQTIVNILRILSRNMNVDPEYIDKLGMKNEYLWLTHVPAEVSKHYFAYTVLQETTVLTEPEIEIKGVHLKNSAVSNIMVSDGKKLMRSILEKVSSNQKVNLREVVTHIVKMENSVIDSVHRGETNYLKRSKIKAKDAYVKEPKLSPYGRHQFWNEVFGPTYGAFEEPPYDVVKIPTTITTKTALKNWIDSIEDIELKERLVRWITDNAKSNLPTIYLSNNYVAAYGIPKEIISVIAIERIVLDVTQQHRLILETLGVLLYKDTLVKDQFSL